MENTSDSFMPGPLLFCMKIERSVCYKVTDNILDFLSVFSSMVGYLAVWNHNVRFFADVAACHKSHLLLCKLESVMTEAVLIGKPVGDVILHFYLFSFTKKTVFILIIFF